MEKRNEEKTKIVEPEKKKYNQDTTQKKIKTKTKREQHELNK